MIIMKNINDRNSCPMAGEVESLLNTVRPSSVHLEELLKRYPERILGSSANFRGKSLS